MSPKKTADILEEDVEHDVSIEARTKSQARGAVSAEVSKAAAMVQHGCGLALATDASNIHGPHWAGGGAVRFWVHRWSVTAQRTGTPRLQHQQQKTKSIMEPTHLASSGTKKGRPRLQGCGSHRANSDFRVEGGVKGKRPLKITAGRHCDTSSSPIYHFLLGSFSTLEQCTIHVDSFQHTHSSLVYLVSLLAISTTG